MAQIQVTIIEGRNIKKKDLFSQSDPFVQIYLDDKNQQQKSQVKHNTKNPQWNETIVLYDIFTFSLNLILSFV
jgi:Ca2+-dependent lipid-binding protein